MEVTQGNLQQNILCFMPALKHLLIVLALNKARNCIYFLKFRRDIVPASHD